MDASSKAGYTTSCSGARARTPAMTATRRDGRSGWRGPPSCSETPDGPATMSVTPRHATGAPPSRSGPTVLRLPTMAAVMQAWVVDQPGPVDDGPLVRIDRAVPEAGPGEVRVRVRACGVCRTDLHLAEGDLAPRRPRVTPGHEVVGVVDQLGPGTTPRQRGDRIPAPSPAPTPPTRR